MPDVKSIELMQFSKNEVSFITHRQLQNIFLRSTAAGEGHAFIVVSISGEEDAATAARASYAMIADALYDRRMEIVS